MLLFRSEEEVQAWCERARPRAGRRRRHARLHASAARWYGDRLDPGWRPRAREASQAILDDVGLTGDFWRLP